MKPPLLFLSQVLPYPPDSGVAIRTYNTMRELPEGYYARAAGQAEEFAESMNSLLFAIGLAIGFRAGVWNIGAEGQFLMGSVFAAGVAIAVGVGCGSSVGVGDGSTTGDGETGDGEKGDGEALAIGLGDGLGA